MTNRGAVSQTVTPGTTYTIPAGYHNGSGKIVCVDSKLIFSNSGYTTTTTHKQLMIGSGRTDYSNTLATISSNLVTFKTNVNVSYSFTGNYIYGAIFSYWQIYKNSSVIASRTNSENAVWNNSGSFAAASGDTFKIVGWTDENNDRQATWSLSVTITPR